MNALEVFLRGGAAAQSDHWYVWYRAPGLWITTIWGRPSPDEISALVRVWGLALPRGINEPFVSLVDLGKMELAGGPATLVLLDYMRAHKADFQRLLRRQAITRPEGIIGAAATGFFAMLAYTLPVQLFTDPRAGLDWLLDGAGQAVADETARRVAAVRALPRIVRELRVLLDNHPSMDVGKAAQALAVSRRTLQRQLDDAGTSFRAERGEARIRWAQRLLAETDDKVTAIASTVGFSSLQHFARMFRAHFGLTPLEWRQRHR